MNATDTSTDTSMKGSRASGIWSPALTPMTADLAPDTGRFIRHARWLLDNGCHGLALFGTTSEATSLSVGERCALLDAALEDGLPAEQLMIGTGCPALPDSVELTRHALSNGIHRVLMLPPYYYKGSSDEALARSYGEVIERAGSDSLQVYLYHFPKLSGVPVTLGLLDLLHERFPAQTAGVKDSSGDWQNTRAMIERYPDMAIFPGSEALLLDGLRYGGAGCITAAANANPHGVRAVWDAFASGSGEAENLDRHMRGVRRALDTQPMIPALKHVTAARTGDDSWRNVRPPLLPLGDAAGAALDAALDAASYAAPARMAA